MEAAADSSSNNVSNVYSAKPARFVSDSCLAPCWYPSLEGLEAAVSQYFLWGAFYSTSSFNPFGTLYGTYIHHIHTWLG
jgi:hypothetical protein